MECNKDEAARAKTIAEKKLQDRDFAGAKKFALKAQNLYPPLEGLSQTLTTLDVYIAAENKISGEMDWYGVLGVAPSADDETIRKQYRKLALMLHPDKNKSVGADGAFKLLSEAWGLLSDKGKRLAYNQRRSSRGFQHKMPSQTGRPPAPSGNVSQTGRPPAAPSGYVPQTGRPPATPSGNGSQTGRPSTAPSGNWSQTGRPSTAPSGNWSQTGRPSTAPSGNWSQTGRPSTAPIGNGSQTGRPSAAPSGNGSQTGRPSAAPSGNGSQTGRPSAAPSGNGFHNFTNRAQPKPKTPKNTVPPPAFRRTDTFWTICHNCKMHYEYLKVYLNHTLLCPNCHQAFMAAEMAPPANFPKASNSSSEQSRQNINNHAPTSKPGQNATSTQNVRQGGSAGPNLHKHSKPHSGAYSNVAGTGNTEPSIAAKAANVIQHVNERLKREREESQGSVFKGEVPSKRRVIDGEGHCHGDKLPFKAPPSSGAGSRSISGLHGFSDVNNRPNGTRELTLLETRNMLMEKARKEVKKKLSEWNSEAANKAEEKRKAEQRKKEQMKNAMKSDENLNVVAESSPAKDETAEHFTGASGDGEGKEERITLSMNVPDPDFHDFDMDRTESSFGDNQTWAAYDDDDGMPRFYAFIHKVISRKPFKMKISWLNSKTNSEFGPLEWVSCGFAKTSGEFRIGKYEVNKSLNSFSHKVKWTKGTRGVLQILPKKGDVWALYRNWSHDWNEHTPDEVIHKYDMVKVLDDYNEEQSVSVTPLIKVAGFRTVFHPHQDTDKVMRIPKEEMFRFSHQVPHYMLTGQEAENAPRGFLELDPAATPLELLQVITEADATVMKKGANVEEKLQGTSGTGVVETAEGALKTVKEQMV